MEQNPRSRPRVGLGKLSIRTSHEEGTPGGLSVVRTVNALSVRWRNELSMRCQCSLIVLFSGGLSELQVLRV